jgi:sulfite reductase (ferredoxin)
MVRRYYYDLLKPLASLETLLAEDYIDWGQEEKFATAIGVGECAGVDDRSYIYS